MRSLLPACDDRVEGKDLVSRRIPAAVMASKDPCKLTAGFSDKSLIAAALYIPVLYPVTSDVT